MSSALPTKNVHFRADSVQPPNLSVHSCARNRAVRANRADSVQEIPVPSPRYTFPTPWRGSCKVNHGSPHTPKIHKTPRRVEFRFAGTPQARFPLLARSVRRRRIPRPGRGSTSFWALREARRPCPYLSPDAKNCACPGDVARGKGATRARGWGGVGGQARGAPPLGKRRARPPWANEGRRPGPARRPQSRPRTCYRYGLPLNSPYFPLFSPLLLQITVPFPPSQPL